MEGQGNHHISNNVVFIEHELLDFSNALNGNACILRSRSFVSLHGLRSAAYTKKDAGMPQPRPSTHTMGIRLHGNRTAV